MPGKGSNGADPAGSRDRELWRRSRGVEARVDEAERFLDLAGFADGRLDDDDTARVAALLARDRAAAADVTAARALAEAAVTPADERIVVHALSLVDAGAGAEVIAFPPPRRVAAQPWFSAARWSGLAAAIVLASWLGFDLGSGFYEFGATARSPDDVSANELIDPAPLVLRDFTENSQI